MRKRSGLAAAGVGATSRSRRAPRWVVVGLAALGCATAGSAAVVRWSPPPRGPKTIAALATGTAITASSGRQIAARFSALVAEHPDLTYADLAARLDLARARAPEAGPSFDPTRAEYWNQIRDKMELTPEEQDLYRRWGVVGVDHAQHYSMAAAYLAIYRRDLPVLITTDSILHALHRSFDDILIELETAQFWNPRRPGATRIRRWRRCRGTCRSIRFWGATPRCGRCWRPSYSSKRLERRPSMGGAAWSSTGRSSPRAATTRNRRCFGATLGR
jgi:hypothetical protein